MRIPPRILATGIAVEKPEGFTYNTRARYNKQLCHTRRRKARKMKKLQNMMAHIGSFENLLGAYKDAARNKRYRAEVLSFGLSLEENLLDIQDDLVNRTYTVGPYRQFYVQYPKPRLVMALGFRDRVVQWAIYRQVNPFIDKRFIAHSYGCRKDKGTLAAAERLFKWMQLISRKPDVDDWRIIKCDVSKFFYRVDHEIVMNLYKEYSDDEWFLWLMGVIVHNLDTPFGLPEGVSADDCPPEERLFEVGMPIGNLTSQETANIYLNKLDQYCKHVLKLHYYVRYMDDIIVLVKGYAEAERVRGLIEAFLRDRLRLSMSKKAAIYSLRQGCEFVGNRVTPHGIRLRKKTTKHVKHSLQHVMKMHAAGTLTLEEAMQTVNSYMGLTKHKNGYNLRRWIAENISFQRKEP